MGYPTVIKVQFVQRIAIPQGGFVQNPLVTITLALKRLAWFRLVQINGIPACSSLQYPGCFPGIGKRVAPQIFASNTVLFWTQTVTVGKNQAPSLWIGKSKRSLTIQRNKEGLRPKRRIHTDFHELPLLVRHVCRVRKNLHKLGTGRHQGGKEQDVFQDKPLGVFPNCYPVGCHLAEQVGSAQSTA